MEKAKGLPIGIVERVQQGLPIIYPTSTLPALGCLPQTEALDSLFELKRRSESKIVSLGVCSLEQAEEIVEVPDIASDILGAFPMGALTLILPARETLDARLGGNAVAVRVLADARARELIAVTGPLTATSANPSGADPVTDCEIAAKILELPKSAALPGKCVGGAPSTLIRWNVSGDALQDSDWSIIRVGKVSAEEIQAWSMQRT
ncbi:MAG TPA: L-threonylcarbamoyladenylate synthase [Candidatus Thalassarchaeaceae archaeon]|jgi:L-threonylcarbamoyladenylate synthase|nr:L-threonylcarbamoyladenylate synthase [Candidatus Thalassarchaeaceae archaeon]HJM67769.1 L-threonylcarbamoyladenylate synthase [Candidatus Thalassarchaeaceae archaeon]